jgi:transposase InsO family protein
VLRRHLESGQYLAGDYRQQITDLRMVQSVGRTGVCWDNSVAESFWSSLKRELVHRYRFPDRASARRAIFAWINAYIHRRLHSSLGYIPPVEWENQYRQPEANLAA